MKHSFRSKSVEETIRFGSKLGRALTPGTVLGLKGGLGSGKTTLIQGISEGLGVQRKEVKSPTFVIFHIYKGLFPVYHFDLYRLEKEEELAAIGFEEFVSDPAVISLVEWAEKARALLPDDVILIHLHIKGPEEREFALEATGPKSKAIIQKFLKK